VANEAEARARAEAEARLSQEAVKLQRETEERVEAARRRAETEVQEKVERARQDALSGSLPDESPEEEGGNSDEPGRLVDPAPGEPAGTRYVGGRRLRTF
jgi:hypothetical protein